MTVSRVATMYYLKCPVSNQKKKTLKKNKVGGFTLQDIKSHSTLNGIVMVKEYTNSPMNRREFRNKPHIYDHLT